MKIEGTTILKAESENFASLEYQEHSLWWCQLEQLLRSTQGFLCCAESEFGKGQVLNPEISLHKNTSSKRCPLKEKGRLVGEDLTKTSSCVQES